MSSSNFIREILDILDFNITFPTNDAAEGIGVYSKEFYKGETCYVFSGVLSYQPNRCLKCKEKNEKSLIKWGFKTVMTQLNKVSEYKTYLRLKKQRFKCKKCNQTFIAESTLTRFNCSISNRVKLKIATMLEDSVSMTYIAKQIGVATMTVLRVLRDFYQPKLPEKQELPKVLCFDEFKSGSFAEGAMSCIIMDGEHTRLLDVLEDRRKVKLETYFQRYSLNDRNQVKIVVTDFYEPYISLTKEFFPKAKVLIDRFHIIQLIGRSFKNHRIAVMKRFNQSDKRYKHLKKYWKLLQKKADDLNWEKRYWSPSFKAHLTQTEIVNRLLSYSEELEQGYEIYQSFLSILRYSEKKEQQIERIECFKTLLEQPFKAFPENFKTTIKTYKKYKEEIILALTLPYSNGPVEATNNHIKVLKRTAYGFRNFINFKTRIFINRGKYFKTRPIQTNKKDQAVILAA